MGNGEEEERKGDGRWCVPCLEVPLADHVLADLLERHAFGFIEAYDSLLVEVPTLGHLDFCVNVV